LIGTEYRELTFAPAFGSSNVVGSNVTRRATPKVRSPP
jgi:hypothetical protein